MASCSHSACLLFPTALDRPELKEIPGYQDVARHRLASSVPIALVKLNAGREAPSLAELHHSGWVVSVRVGCYQVSLSFEPPATFTGTLARMVNLK